MFLTFRKHTWWLVEKCVGGGAYKCKTRNIPEHVQLALKAVAAARQGPLPIGISFDIFECSTDLRVSVDVLHPSIRLQPFVLTFARI